jgi:hypothetical protein
MNVHQMMSLLSIRLADIAGSAFTEDERLTFLNNAQLKLARKINAKYFTELEVLETSRTATAGKYAISSLANTVLKGGEGILKVKINGGKYCTELDMDMIKRTETTYYAGSLTNPLYYIYNNYIYVSNGQTNPVIVIYYLKIPTELVYTLTVEVNGASATTFKIDATDSPSAVDDYYNGASLYNVDKDQWYVVTDYTGSTRIVTVCTIPGGANFVAGEKFYFFNHNFDTLAFPGIDCDLNESLHDLVLSLAEAEAWAMDSKLTRKESAMADVNGKSTILDARYTEAEGIGTQNRYNREPIR